MTWRNTIILGTDPYSKSMRLFTRILLMFPVFGVSILLLGCRSDQPVEIINSEYCLTNNQIEQYTREAIRGDTAAASKLYRYYYYIKSDNRAALKWLSVIATNDVWAQYLLARFYSGEFSSELSDTNMALYWYKRAASGGETNAIAKLKELGLSPVVT